MINKAELTLGAYVMDNDGNTFQWDETRWYLENIHPIPITDERLLAFGFEFREDTQCWHYYSFILNKLYVMQDIDIHVSLKHIHQLQGLYLFLTGEVLTKK